MLILNDEELEAILSALSFAFAQKNQRNAEGVLPISSENDVSGVREEAYANWQQGIKSSLIVHALLKLCKRCLSMIL